MGRLLLNRFTKYSILTKMAALAAVGLGLGVWTDAGIKALFIIIAIVLCLSAVGLEFLGFSRAKHFTQTNARIVYDRTRQLILELRKTAQVLHTEYGSGNDADSRWKYDRDKRYKELLRRFDEALSDCDDRHLAKMLGDLITSEKRLARRGINLNARTLGFPQTLEMAEPKIKNYISTNIAAGDPR